MNNYPQWWDTTVTLYNKYIDAETREVKWFRHVLRDCFYKHTLEKVTVNDTTISSDATICRVRVNDSFIRKDEWNKLQDDDKTKYFTLCAGDIVVADEVDFEIDEYEKGKRSSDLIQSHKDWPGCFMIEIVNINVGGGRGNEHYYVKGS